MLSFLFRGFWTRGLCPGVYVQMELMSSLLVRCVCSQSVRGRTLRTNWTTRRHASTNWQFTWRRWVATSDAWRQTSSQCTPTSTRHWTPDAPPTSALTACRWTSTAWPRNCARYYYQTSPPPTLRDGNKARFPLSELTARVDGWPVSITRQHCWRAHVSTSRVDGSITLCTLLHRPGSAIS